VEKINVMDLIGEEDGLEEEDPNRGILEEI